EARHVGVPRLRNRLSRNARRDRASQSTIVSGRRWRVLRLRSRAELQRRARNCADESDRATRPGLGHGPNTRRSRGNTASGVEQRRATLMFGRFLEISVYAPEIRDSLAFYESLGFVQAPVGEAFKHPYAVVTDGRLFLGLHGRAAPSPALTFVMPRLMHGMEQ